MSGLVNPGTLVRAGTATIDFGSTPGVEASVEVAGQAGILSNSQVRVSLQGDTMGTNTADDFILAAATVRFVTSAPTAGTGFTIYAISDFALWTSRFRVRWRWS